MRIDKDGKEKITIRSFLFDMFVLFVHIVRMKSKRVREKTRKVAETSEAREKRELDGDKAGAGSAVAEKPNTGKDPVKSEKTQAVQVVTDYGPPPPEYVYEDAMNEPDRRVLRDYSETIRLLREKGFTFREIAEWLNGRGIDADHNAVYRVYVKTMDPVYMQEIEREMEEEEREE